MVTLTTYNLHGFNQGKSLLPHLCTISDIILVQEHWLYDDELHVFDGINADFFSVCSSAMSSQGRLRLGRPFGGVGFIVKKSLMPVFKCVAKRERFIIICVGDVLIVNVYLPCISTHSNYEESLCCIMSDICNVIQGFGYSAVNNIIIGGDFNFECIATNLGYRTFHSCTRHLNLSPCDNMIDVSSCSNYVPVTYYQLGSGRQSFIDHFWCSASLQSCIAKSYIVDSGLNMSDHLPLSLDIAVKFNTPSPTPSISSTSRRLRWDKADTVSYYYGTYECLSKICIPDCVQRCMIGCNCEVQSTVDSVYADIVNALLINSDRCVPKTKSGFYKHWWNERLDELKQASIGTHNLWKMHGRPRSGEIFMQMKTAKIAYKNAIKASEVEDNMYFSNDLHELLMEKDMVGFWKCWNAKVVKSRPSAVIDGATDGHTIVQKFASHFQKSCEAGSDSILSAKQDSEIATKLHDYITCANANKFSLLDVETVDRCLRQMSKCKAPGIDNIEVEHLLYAHPLAVVLLCVLFNVMLKHGTVPRIFSSGIIVPVVKDKHGDTTDINNYRGITLSPSISKLFEKCLLVKFGELLAVSPQQYGFQKKLSCGHAIYSLRSVVDYYVSGLSTVNVAFVDLSKAFDRVNHNIMFFKLMQRKLPPTVLKLLMIWYKNSMVTVRWNLICSPALALAAGVRQGGVLSPILFCVYIDDVVKRLVLSRMGCWVGGCYLGCILYADDLILMSSSVCDLQKMVDLCADEFSNCDMRINASKCAVMRFGPRVAKHCAEICIQGVPVAYCDKTKYLGVMLRSSVKFAVDLSYMKAKFYRAFNSLFHKCSKLRDELVTLQLVSAYCKPHLLYATECLGLSVTQMRSLQNTWQCAVSHVFNVTGATVQFICSATDNSSLDIVIIDKRIRFLDNMYKLNRHHDILYTLYMRTGMRELSRLKEVRAAY